MILFIVQIDSRDDENKRFRLYFNKYYKYAKAIAYNVTGSMQNVEDIAQEAFISLWKVKEKMVDDTSAKALVSVITRNTSINYLKKSVYAAGHTAPLEECTVAGPSAVSDPLEIVVDRENVNFIRGEMKSLDRIYSDALLLKYGFGLEPDKIAELLGVGVKTVYTRLARGRELLKKKLLIRESEVRRNEQRVK